MLNRNVKIQKNQKFTTATIGCFLRLPLTQRNLAITSLLARMQMNASKAYPSIPLQQRALSEAYDMQVEIVPQLFGNALIYSYIINFIEPRVVLDPDYTYAEIITKIREVISVPLLDEDLMNFSKAQILTSYQELIEEPSNYALDRFFKIWYKDQPDYADNFIGSPEMIKDISVGALDKFIDKDLRVQPGLMIGWAHDNQLVTDLLNHEFRSKILEKDFAKQQLSIPAPILETRDEEEQGNLQAQLLLGYGYHQGLKIDGQIIGSVFSQYLAGDQSSKLFTEVREKLGAAYDIVANNYANNCLFLVSAGLDPEKVKPAEQIIKAEIQKIAEGQIDLDLLKKAKKSLLNTRLIGQDQEGWQLAQMLRSNLFTDYDLVDHDQKIKTVTPTMLKRFAQNLFLNESYVLK
ncbi:insulinase family protein [Lactobacillus sp. HT06-2]|uniref:insulinase family protein n=1 Tax=Lactobacillus sp. HT06-2 TaxID=2080222 RepID=UPI000CD92CD7|nr:insulinase family protein [Lactobacillus sp. HT06-2]